MSPNAPRITFNTLRDMLLLVGRDLSREKFNAWSQAERNKAERWAAATHLRASDNPVKVPPLPAHVSVLPEVTL